jgi:hypothetical protein
VFYFYTLNSLKNNKKMSHKIYIKWSDLNKDQREEIKTSLKEDVEKKQIVLNQRRFRINALTGQYMNQLI